MVFSRFNLGLLLRVVIIFIFSLITAYSFVVMKWTFTPLVFAILIVISLIELYRHLSFYSRSLKDFLIIIRQSGFNASFPVKDKKGNELTTLFNEIIRSFQELSLEKEKHYQFLQTLTENLDVALIAYNDLGEINWINPEAKSLVNKPGLTNLSDLDRVQPQFTENLKNLKPGQKKLALLASREETIEVSMQLTRIRIDGEMMNVAMFQNIHREMEIKEVEAWQKLTRVMRHEIMNSMTPIVNLTEAVNKVIRDKGIFEKNEDLEDIKDSMSAIENRSKGLVKFVNAYKDFSQTPELKLTDFRLLTMLEKILSLLEPDLAAKNIQVELGIKPASLMIRADEELLEQVVINLFKNSIEAFEAGPGRIDVHGRNDGDTCILQIVDNGPGIGPDMLERIFIPFYTTKENGSGIGLSLSRQIIQLHGGTINVSSNKGSGTKFIIEI